MQENNFQADWLETFLENKFQKKCTLLLGGGIFTLARIFSSILQSAKYFQASSDWPNIFKHLAVGQNIFKHHLFKDQKNFQAKRPLIPVRINLKKSVCQFVMPPLGGSAILSCHLRGGTNGGVDPSE